MVTEREALYDRITKIENDIVRLAEVVSGVIANQKRVATDWLDREVAPAPEEAAILPTGSAPRTKKKRYYASDDERVRILAVYTDLRRQMPELTTWALCRRVRQATATKMSDTTIWHLLIDYGAPKDGKRIIPNRTREA